MSLSLDDIERNSPPRVAAIVLGLLLVGLAACFEIIEAIPLGPEVYFVLALFWTLALLPELTWRFDWRIGVIWFLVLIAFYMVFSVVWTSRKAFLADLERLNVGMAKAEVQNILKPYIRLQRPKRSDVAEPEAGTPDQGDGFEIVSQGGETFVVEKEVYYHSTEIRHADERLIIRYRDGKVWGLSWDN